MAASLIAVGLTSINLSSYAQQVDWGERSALLKLDMTEQQVVQTIGYRPSKVEMQTCGQQSSTGAWRCKIYTFGFVFNNLRIYFAQVVGDLWVVNNWEVYP
jgi:hypothetical protein